jgi:hypothetical protein
LSDPLINMKKIVIILLYLYSSNAFAQNESTTNPVYYLLDTSKTPISERIWHIDNDGPWKYYTIQCHCLQYNAEPTFAYDTRKDISRIISKKELKSITLINISDLIDSVKKNLENGRKEAYTLFLIEPYKKKYVSHKLNLVHPNTVN